MTEDATLAAFLGVSLLGSNSLSNGLFNLRRQLQQTLQNVSFYYVPSFVHSYIH